MKKSITFILLFCFIFTAKIHAQFSAKDSVNLKFLLNHPHRYVLGFPISDSTVYKKTSKPEKRYWFDYLKKVNPATGEYMQKEFDYAQNLADQQIKSRKSSRISGGLSDAKFWRVGPTNVGGRTRAIMYDPNDPTQKRVFAGSVSGGLWVNDDITSATSPWQEIILPTGEYRFGCLDYDPSNPQIFYAASGELSTGTGLYISRDAGKTWAKCPNFPQGNYGSYISALCVSNVGIVYVGASGFDGNGGTYKSMDQGNTWTKIREGAPSSIQRYKNNGVIWDRNHWTDGNSVEVADKDGNISTLFNEKEYGGRSYLSYVVDSLIKKEYIYHLQPSKQLLRISEDNYKTWRNVTFDNSIPNFQGGYCIALAVNPRNPKQIFVGGVDLLVSNDFGKTWINSPSHHADHHAIIFNKLRENEAIITTDGGLGFTDDIGSNKNVEPRAINYTTTQFYSVAIRDYADDNHVMGGTQDNGTIQMSNDKGGQTISGGDGDACFYDEDDPNCRITSYQEGYFRIQLASIDEKNYGNEYSVSTKYGFIQNPAVYDAKNNIFYSPSYNSSGRGANLMVADVSQSIKNPDLPFYVNAFSARFSKPFYVSYLAIEPITNILWGVGDRELFRYKNPLFKQTIDEFIKIPTYSTSCFEFLRGNKEMIVAGYYQENSLSRLSVLLTQDEGNNWQNATGNLPPIRVTNLVANPQNPKQVLAGTEAGLWFTDDIYAQNPQWQVVNQDLSQVPIRMLRYKNTDGTVAVGTYGKGIWLTDIFKKIPPINHLSKAKIGVTQKYCKDAPIVIDLPKESNYSSKTRFLGVLTNTYQRVFSVTYDSVGKQLRFIIPFRSISKLITFYIINTTDKARSPEMMIELKSNITGLYINSPTNYTACEGYTIPLKVIMESPYGNEPPVPDSLLAYQWFEDNKQINGAIQKTYQAKNNTNYSVEVTDKRCPNSQLRSQITLQPFSLSNAEMYYSVFSLKSKKEVYQNEFCDNDTVSLKIDEIVKGKIRWFKNGIELSDTTKSLNMSKSAIYGFQLQQGNCLSKRFERNLSRVKVEMSVSQTEICKGEETIIRNDTKTDFYLWSFVRNGQELGPNYNYLLNKERSFKQIGKYAVKISSGSYSCVSKEVEVSDKPIINLLSPTKLSFCEGISSELKVENSLNYSFQWYRNNTLISNQINPSMTINEGGSYKVAVGNHCKNTLFSNEILANIIPKPSVAFTEVEKNFIIGKSIDIQLKFTSNSPWDFRLWDDKKYTTSTNPYNIKFIPTDTTKVLNIKSVSNECGEGKILNLLKLILVLENEPTLSEVSWKVFPNPTKEKMTVSVNCENCHLTNYSLFQTNGQVIKTIPLKLNKASEYTFDIDVSMFLTGSYLFKIETDKGNYVQKFVVER